jgi:hypothetical protein
MHEGFLVLQQGFCLHLLLFLLSRDTGLGLPLALAHCRRRGSFLHGGVPIGLPTIRIDRSHLGTTVIVMVMMMVMVMMVLA